MSTIRANSGTTTVAHDDRAAERSQSGQAYAVWLLIAFAGLIGFVLLSVTVASHAPIPIDQSLLATARSWDGNPLICRIVSETAKIPLIVIGCGLLAWLVW